jgi:hypothetical protein
MSLGFIPLKIKFLQEAVLQGPLRLLPQGIVMQGRDHLLEDGDVIELIAL